MNGRRVSFVVRVLRFGLVGIVATLTYLASAAVGALAFDLAPMVNNVVAASLSIIVSYLGHNYFTFDVGGHHPHYLPRYLIATAILFGASVVVTYVGEHVFRLAAFSIAIFVSAIYPVLSVLINMAWTFAPATRRRGPSA